MDIWQVFGIYIYVLKLDIFHINPYIDYIVIISIYIHLWFNIPCSMIPCYLTQVLTKMASHLSQLGLEKPGVGEWWRRWKRCGIWMDLRGFSATRHGFHPTESWFWDVLSQGFCPGFFRPGIWLGGNSPGFQEKNVFRAKVSGTFRGPMAGYTVAAIAIFSLRFFCRFQQRFRFRQ